MKRDLYEVANQLEGYVGPTTPDRLAEFLLREGGEAAKLADEILRLRTALAPFADFAARIAKEHPGWDHDSFWLGDSCPLTMAPFRTALAVLKDEG